MIHVVGPTLTGSRVTLRVMQESDAGELRRLRAAPAVAEWWGPVEDEFPNEDEPEATRMCILVDGRIAGLVQYGEEPDESFRHAWIDMFVDAEMHGRGIGTDALETLVEHLLTEGGHHRVTIDPAADNLGAIRCYEKVGFRRVGVMESAERDEHTGRWRDVILMELVRLPVGRPPAPHRATD
ncbi:MAG TPA: GNAT family protein [Solirubrobacteraceae bacterium]|jgi:aminoglycoside 6'-N-acetyltransferase|nr:GNAT family protein [Solirubrobacteraceae bacterium]